MPETVSMPTLAHRQHVAMQTLLKEDISTRPQGERWLKRNPEHERVNIIRLAIGVAFPKKKLHVRASQTQSQPAAQPS